MKPEQKLYQDLKTKALDKLVGVRHDRVEPMFGFAIPDLTFTYEGHHGWIELKVCEYLKAKGCDGSKVPMQSPVKMDWRPNQRKWLYDRDRLGGNCWLLVWHHTGYYALKGIYAMQVAEAMSLSVTISPQELTGGYYALHSTDLNPKFLRRIMQGK
ncbi:hypothetical protein IBZ20DMU1_40 [Acinetobacter phage DMU1]|nr:hypothetical protein IBZ20DMU1_40 [Acinetobacter phage DMU1]